jgi:RNA polymerase sigma-70 factor (ECF subfamily)
MSDEQLLQLHRAGRVEALEMIIERYKDELFHFLLRFTNDPASADDLFQEAFLQVHLSAESFDTDRRFRPWLFTIAANKARDHLRRMKSRKASQLSAPIDGNRDGEGGTFSDLIEGTLPLPPENLERADTQERVRAVVALMPDHLREVLLLAYFNQFPYRDIATMLSIPVGTVKSRVHAAVAAFAALWRQNYPDND